MKTTDNNEYKIPEKLRIIEENRPVGQLIDNCIYILAENNSRLAETADSFIDKYKLADNCEKDFINNYEVEIIDYIELKNHAFIKERIDRHGDNLVIQLFTPSEKNKKFIVTNTNDNEVISDICQVIYTAEHFSRNSLQKILKKHALENTQDFLDSLKDLLSLDKFVKTYLADSISSLADPVCNMAASTPFVSFHTNYDGILNYKKQMEIIRNFKNNIKKYHKKPTPEIEAELDIVIKMIDTSTLKKFFSQLSPKNQEQLGNLINPDVAAKESKMDLEIIYHKDIDKVNNTFGRYRLLMKRDYEQTCVHFRRRPAFVLYLIYLMDKKKRGDNVDTLNLKSYRHLFGRLFEMTYGINGESVFDDMMRQFNKNNTIQQKELYNIMKVMREDIGASCERMNEPVEPFIISNVNSHLAVLPSHIIIPNEIISLI